ncbi:Sedlin_N domain-containing protein, partial [Cephalotus follicularis]
VNNLGKTGPTLNETFLGLFYPTKKITLYGFLPSTKLKFILVMTDLDVKNASVRNVSI